MNCPEALSTRSSRTLYDGQGFGTFDIVRRCLGLSWISVNPKRKKVRISSSASGVWPRKICRVILDKGSTVNSSQIHGSGRLVTMKQIRLHPPMEGRWNTLPKSRRTLDCTSSPSHSSSPSIIMTMGCVDSSETCCSGSRISFCSCISNAFVGIDGLLATTASMILPTSGMAKESSKEIVGNRKSALLRPLAEAYREKKKLPASHCAASHSLQSDWEIAVLPAPAGPLNHRTLDVRVGSSIQLIISPIIVLRVFGWHTGA